MMIAFYVDEDRYIIIQVSVETEAFSACPLSHTHFSRPKQSPTHSHVYLQELANGGSLDHALRKNSAMCDSNEKKLRITLQIIQVRGRVTQWAGVEGDG